MINTEMKHEHNISICFMSIYEHIFTEAQAKEVDFPILIYYFSNAIIVCNS